MADGGGEPGAVVLPGGALESPGEVARIAGVTGELVRIYVRLGLIPCVVDGSGRRSFPPGTGLRVRAIKAERMVRRPREAKVGDGSAVPADPAE